MAANASEILYCSFCGKSQHEVSKLIAGPGVFICDECVELCGDIILNEKNPGGRDQVSTGEEASTDAPPPQRLAFLLSPLGKPFDKIFREHIGPAIESAGFTIEAANRVFGTRPEFAELWKRIGSATLVVADLTGSDPGVMYELGMAHAAGTPTMIITQNIDDVPFDGKLDRCVVYSSTPRGCAKLADEIKATLRSLRP